MIYTQALSLLALRRLGLRLAVSNGHLPQLQGPWPFPAGDGLAAASLRRISELAWLTIEVLACHERVGARLDGADQDAFGALVENPAFAAIVNSLLPFRKQLARDLHLARRSGVLTGGEIQLEQLHRQLSQFARPADLRTAQELEWFALWQMSDELARAGYPGLKSLFEARSDEGDSLLVGLLTSLLAADEGDLVSSAARWLGESAPRLEALLDEGPDAVAERAPQPARQPAEAAARIRQGQSHAQRGDYERAAVEYTAALHLDPSSATAHLFRGDAYRLQGDYERAIADYTAAIRLDPKNVLAYLNRGTVHRLRGEYRQAAADYSEALRVDPNNGLAYAGRGVAHAQEGEYDLAVADLTQALRLDPGHPWTYQSRGDAYAGKGEYDLAVADYSEALRLNPHFPLALVNRGDAYRLRGEFDRAVADYTEAIRLDPLNPRNYTNRGDAYRRQHKLDQALADFGEAIRLDPTNPAVYLHRGVTLQMLGQYDRAVADLDRAEQFDPDNPEVYHQRALAYKSRSDYDRALADLTRAIELNPRDAVALLNRGSLHALRQEYDEALADFDAAIRRDRRSATAFLERGRVRAVLGDLDHALSDLGEALNVDPQLVPARLLRGGVLLRMGQYQAAVREFDEAIAVNPRYAKAYNDRGVACSKLGQLEPAVEDFGRALRINPDYAPALANRATAYQLLGRHSAAMQDVTRALLLESRYAAPYCVQRGLLLMAKDDYESAAADFTVALLLDPHNRTARGQRQKALQLRELQFDINVPAESVAAEEPARPDEGVPAPEAADAAPDGAEATQVRLPAAETQTEMQLPDEDIGEIPEDEEAAAEQEAGADEEEAAVAEQARQAEQERQQALARAEALRRQAEEAMRRDEEAKRAKAQREGKRKAPSPEDEEEARDCFRRIARWALGVAAVLLFLLAGGAAFSALYPTLFPAKVANMTTTEVAAEDLFAEYEKDTTRANGKYSEQYLRVKGKVGKVVRGGQRGSSYIVFEAPARSGAAARWGIVAVLRNPDDAQSLQQGQEVTVVGQVELRKPKGGDVALSASEIVSKGGAAAASGPGGGPRTGFTHSSPNPPGIALVGGYSPVSRPALRSSFAPGGINRMMLFASVGPSRRRPKS